MTATPGTTPPFPGFPGFPPAEVLEQMWGMMRLSPFGSAFSGAQPGSSLGPSLSMMSDMMAPLTNVEELDKRITDMRAVEQWLKLNLNMLQSAIQALEVQRATLATLRAFGAFAQSSMAQPAAAPSPSPTGWPHPEASSGSTSASPSAAPEPATEEGEAAGTPPFDASAWWNLLQSQFNQIAQFAMTQAATAAATADGSATDSPEEGATSASASAGNADDAPEGSVADAGTAAKRPAAKRAATSTSTSAKRAGSASAAPRATKKSV
ncbi:PhaM family polyhydroxyalkanoate granule multifunctional regulatory protein [Paraburkholderia caffeinilytica]|uniref:PhaM family polyhydroxyalkanoate granule multifunctional regulatory protein n=1 Tax=Paraburkholderia caffeinilytica TaxID=1761016 RepID=UPI0038B6DCB1